MDNSPNIEMGPVYTEQSVTESPKVTPSLDMFEPKTTFCPKN